MKLFRYLLVPALSVILIGCSESGPRNILDGADQDKIDAYKAEQAAIAATETDGELEPIDDPIEETDE